MTDIYAEWAKSKGLPVEQPKKAQATTKKKQEGGLADWLPTIGGTLGALGGGAAAGAAVGSILPGAGTLVGGSIGLLGALLGGAVGSGAGKVGENAVEGEQDLGKGVGQEALLGAATSLPVGAGLKLARAGVKASTGFGKKSVEQLVSEAGQSALPRRVAGKGVAQTVDTASSTVPESGLLSTMKQNVNDKAAANFLGLTPTQAQRLADDGIDQVALGRTAAKYGNTAGDIIGSTGKGGRLQADITRYEGIIDSAAKQADANGVRISGDNLIKALQDERAKLANKLGAGDQVKAIDKIIAQAKKKYGYSDDPLVQEALKYKSADEFVNAQHAADKQYLASIVDKYEKTRKPGKTLGGYVSPEERAAIDAINSRDTKQLTDLYNQAHANPGGVSYSEARQILKDANGKFGSSILDDSGNAVARDAQKLEGNTMRSELKTASPTIADALDNEAQLIQARELMSRKRGADLANKGTALSRVDVTRLGTYVEPLLRSDRLTSRVLRAGGDNAAPQVATGPTGQTLLGALTRQGVGRAGAGALGLNGDQGQQFDQATQDAGVDPTATLGGMDLSGAATAPSNPFGVGLDEVGAQMMQAIANGDSKGYGVLSDLYDRINDYETAAAEAGGSSKPMGVEAQKIANNANSGLQSLNDLEKMINDDPGIVSRAALPDVSLLNSLAGTSTYRAAIKNVQDAMSRLRSGAAMSEKEAARFDQMLPRLGDSPDTIKYKIAQFRSYFGDAASNATGRSSGVDTSSLLQALGVGQ